MSSVNTTKLHPGDTVKSSQTSDEDPRSGTGDQKPAEAANPRDIKSLLYYFIGILLFC